MVRTIERPNDFTKVNPDGELNSYQERKQLTSAPVDGRAIGATD